MKKLALFFSILFTIPAISGTLTIPPALIMNATTLAASIDSAPVHVLWSDNIGIEVVYVGNPTGQFGISGCNDAQVSATGSVTGGNWVAITGTYPAPAGSDGIGLISLTNYPYAFIKLTYVRVSGAGTATATLVAKAI